MTLIFLLATALTPGVIADELFARNLLGATSETLQAMDCTCQVGGALPIEPRALSTLTCRVRLLGRDVDVGFFLSGDNKVMGWSADFPSQRRAAAVALYNLMCAQLRKNYPQYSEERTSLGMQRYFVAPYEAVGAASFTSSNALSGEVALTVRLVPFAAP